MRNAGLQSTLVSQADVKIFFQYEIEKDAESLMFLQDAATDEVLLGIEPSSLQTQLSDISVHMMPQLGCLIQVQNGPDMLQREIPQDWNRQVGAACIYQSMALPPLINSLLSFTTTTAMSTTR